MKTKPANKRRKIAAVAITGQTLLGSSGDFPRSLGNCFDVEDAKGREWRVVNFSVENLKHLLEQGLKWPVAAEEICKGRAVINDSRIGERWYDREFCEVCCPESLLPLPQQLEHEREIARGQRRPSVGGWVSTIIHDPQFP